MPNNPNIDTGAVRQEALKIGGVEDAKLESSAAILKKQFEQEGGLSALEAAKSKLPNGVSDASRDSAIKENILGDALDVGQNRKRTDADAAFKRGNEFVQKDYDSLGAYEKTQYQNDVKAALQATPWLDELYGGLDPAQKTQMAESFLRDPSFRKIVNGKLHDQSTHRIEDKDKQERLDKLKETNPSATWEDAAGQLEQEWIDQTKAIFGTSLNEYLNRTLDKAGDVISSKSAEVDTEMKRRSAEKGRTAQTAVAQTMEKKWSAKGAYDRKRFWGGEDGVVRKDFDGFVNGGLEGIFKDPPTADEKAILDDPDLRKKYETQFGQSLIVKRMRAGKFSRDDMYRLADAEWMGADPKARMDKLQELVTSGQDFQNFIKRGQSEGFIGHDFWQNLKGENPKRRALILAALLAAVALPVVGGAGMVGAAAYVGRSAIS